MIGPAAAGTYAYSGFGVSHWLRLDAGLIAVNGASHENPSILRTNANQNKMLVTSSAHTSYDDDYRIKRSAFAVKSEKTRYCTTGAPVFANSRHTACGKIKSLNNTRGFSGYANNVTFGSLIRIDMCGPGEGSSGGGLFRNNTAYGIFAASTPGKCRKWFTDIKQAELVHNVQVVRDDQPKP